MKRTITIIFMVLFFYINSFASSDMQLSNYKNVKNTDTFRNYIIGVASGFSWSNAFLINEGKEPLFCIPKDFPDITDDDYLEITDEIAQYSMKTNMKDNTPIPFMLLIHLKNIFPCSK